MSDPKRLEEELDLLCEGKGIDINWLAERAGVRLHPNSTLSVTISPDELDRLATTELECFLYEDELCEDEADDDGALNGSCENCGCNLDNEEADDGVCGQCSWWAEQ